MWMDGSALLLKVRKDLVALDIDLVDMRSLSLCLYGSQVSLIQEFTNWLMCRD